MKSTLRFYTCAQRACKSESVLGYDVFGGVFVIRVIERVHSFSCFSQLYSNRETKVQQVYSSLLVEIEVKFCNEGEPGESFLTLYQRGKTEMGLKDRAS